MTRTLIDSGVPVRSVIRRPDGAVEFTLAVAATEEVEDIDARMREAVGP